MLPVSWHSFVVFISNKISRSMEKNQQNRNELDPSSNSRENTGGQHPGQQLPTAQQTGPDRQQTSPGKMEQHSESSFPQNDEETLGTP
jgi:hypothetical protein